MKLGRSLKLTSFALALLSLGTAASAQVSCERYRAELAALNRAGASIRTYEAAAQRQNNEIARLIGYYRAIGCEQGSFFFQPPAECGGIAQRIRALQLNATELAQQATADPSAIEARRRQLEAAVAKACDPAAGIIAEPAPLEATRGTRLVCVRTCDGFFFPLQNEPQGRATNRDLCRALCPNAEVNVYRAPRDGGIEQAVSETGQPYTKLPNALRYQKAFDPSCSCRKAGESWAEALQKAERMIARARGDGPVTQAQSEQLSRVSLARPKMGRKIAKPAAVEPASLTSPPEPETTGSLVHGTREHPRIVAPDLVPTPRATAE
jgi:hypothetical protein